MKSKKSGGRKPARVAKRFPPNPKPYLATNLPHLSFVDFEITVSPTTTAVQYTVLAPLLSSTGLLQQFPQHAKPYVRNGNFGLRQRLRITHCEMIYQVTGAQSNAILSADIYNSVRVAVFQSGVDYLNTNSLYLTGVIAGPRPDQVTRVFYDKLHACQTHAWNGASGYNSPGVVMVKERFSVNMVIDCSSTNASGSGADWQTDGKDLMINFVSDSAAIPHPTVTVSLRLYFEFL